MSLSSSSSSPPFSLLSFSPPSCHLRERSIRRLPLRAEASQLLNLFSKKEKQKKRKNKSLCFAVVEPKKREEPGVAPVPTSYACPVRRILHACTMHFTRPIKARGDLSPSLVWPSLLGGEITKTYFILLFATGCSATNWDKKLFVKNASFDPIVTGKLQ